MFQTITLLLIPMVYTYSALIKNDRQIVAFLFFFFFFISEKPPAKKKKKTSPNQTSPYLPGKMLEIFRVANAAQFAVRLPVWIKALYNKL